MKIDRNLFIVIAIAAMFFGTLAMADDGSCWKPARPTCPGGISNENGRGCRVDNHPGRIVVSDDAVRTQERFCDGHSNSCRNRDRECNILRLKDALWRKVYCVADGYGQSFLGWCLDEVYSNTPTGLNCDGRPCSSGLIDPVPLP